MNERDTQQQDLNPQGPPRMPRWVKVAAVVVGLLVLALVVKFVVDGGAGHGPSRHGVVSGLAALSDAAARDLLAALGA